MKEILDLVSAKENLIRTQNEFVKKINAEFPSIEKSNIEDLLREVSSEFEFLLSSAVRVKSGRLLIPAATGWKDGVVLTRNPGLKRPNEQYSVLSYDKLEKIDKNGMLTFEGSDKWIKLGVLRNDKKIDQDKLVIFYELLERFLEITIVLNSFMEDDSWSLKKKEGTSLRVIENADPKENLWVALGPQHFLVGWGITEKDSRERNRCWESNRMTEFFEENDYRDLTIEKERLIADNFYKIKKVLEELEKEKLSSVKKIEDLLQELKNYNKSFRILMKLT